jgi:hypothetical protein
MAENDEKTDSIPEKTEEETENKDEMNREITLITECVKAADTKMIQS